MKTANDSALIIIDIQGNLAQLMHDKENLFKNVQLLIRGAHSGTSMAKHAPGFFHKNQKGVSPLTKTRSFTHIK